MDAVDSRPERDGLTVSKRREVTFPEVGILMYSPISVFPNKVQLPFNHCLQCYFWQVLFKRCPLCFVPIAFDKSLHFSCLKVSVSSVCVSASDRHRVLLCMSFSVVCTHG